MEIVKKIREIISIFQNKALSVIITAMRVCSNCGKKTQIGRNKSHAQNRSSRSFKANIQKITFKVGEDKLTGNFCTKCIKRIKAELKKDKEKKESNLKK